MATAKDEQAADQPRCTNYQEQQLLICTAVLRGARDLLCLEKKRKEKETASEFRKGEIPFALISFPSLGDSSWLGNRVFALDSSFEGRARK